MNSEMRLPDRFQPYVRPPNFSVITGYFNPNRYRTKRTNYEIFSERRTFLLEGDSLGMTAFRSAPSGIEDARMVLSIGRQSVAPVEVFDEHSE